MLTLENITVTFNKGTALERFVLKDLSLHLEKGEYIVIVGGNGAGKTTLLEVIAGKTKPDKGTVLLANQDCTAHSCLQRSAKIAHVLQDPRKGTMENMTIFENLAFAEKRGKVRWFSPFHTLTKRRQFQEKLSILGMGLEDRLDSLVGCLSGGQRQILSLMMTMMAPSALVLLDEITAALDPKLAEIVMEIAHHMVNEDNKTCIMVTHNMTHALKYGHRTLILEQGRFVKTLTRTEKENLTPSALAAHFTENS